MHENLTFNDCIVIIIYCISSQHKLSKYKHYKNKKWFRLQLIQPIFHSLKRERESEKESVKHSIWLFIYLYTYLLHYLSHLYYIPVHYRWDRGESVLCTYVPHIVVLCTCVRTPLTCLFTYVNIINQLLFNFKAIHNALITANWWTTPSVGALYHRRV